ncbi:MAG: hypothetical protein K9L32_00625 [Chromatiaceae bacterium]|nr:hypothetical protein [Chromatiaceae bacterium]MCF8002709.1 hypothetical protein [Chromatiaceae bacterium]
MLEDTPEQRGIWVKAALGEALHGQVADVLADLDVWCKPRRGKVRIRLDSVHNYLDGNRLRMTYEAYVEAGFSSRLLLEGHTPLDGKTENQSLSGVLVRLHP